VMIFRLPPHPHLTLGSSLTSGGGRKNSPAAPFDRAQDGPLRRVDKGARGTEELVVRRLGRVDYEPTWRAMQAFTLERSADTPDEIWLLEHPPVYTVGQAGRAEHLPSADTGIPIVHVDRGGQITYHGPGQVVAYLLIDLARRGYGVKELVRRMEQAVIELLTEYGVVGERMAGAPGVYAALGNTGFRAVGAAEAAVQGSVEGVVASDFVAAAESPPAPLFQRGEDQGLFQRGESIGLSERGKSVRLSHMGEGQGPSQRGQSQGLLRKGQGRGPLQRGESRGLAKIAALGLRVRRGCSYHGLALNVNMDLSPFSFIDPCGYPNLPVTQCRDLGIAAGAEEVADSLLSHLLWAIGAEAA
jgi:lipoate-protein ligase B